MPTTDDPTTGEGGSTPPAGGGGSSGGSSGKTPPTDPWLWDTTPVPRNRPGIRFVVAKYLPTAPAKSRYVALPNVRCTGITRSLGADPGRATFRYVFDGRTAGAPQAVEQALSTAFTGPLAINPDDELVVRAQRPDGGVEVVFHGRALTFGGHLARDVDRATVGAVGIAGDLWESPIGGAYLRDASNVATGTDFASDVPAQFNPKGQPNATDTPSWATGTGGDGQEGDFRHPTFLDPAVIRSPDVRKAWTLATGARYLIYHHLGDDPPILVPTGDELDQLLQVLEPKSGPIDPSDPATYTAKPIILTDRPLTGRDWPSTLNELLRDRGFGLTFDQDTDDDGNPETTLRIFRLQLGDEKKLYLQAQGSQLDPNLSNVAELQLERDCTQTINRWTVIGRPDRFECAVHLAANFPMAAGDAASAAAIAAYDKSAPNFAARSTLYREFVFDETGEGHYKNGTNAKLVDVASLDAVLGAPGQDGKPAYGCRRRKPIGDLISRDSNGKPRRYRLEIATDIATSATAPGVADGSGTWQVVQGGYELLKDRLGIRITADNPNGWKIGKSQAANAPYPEGVVKVVESLAAPNSVNKPFLLRLTAVIEGDKAVTGVAGPTGASPIKRAIARVIEARDRFARDTVSISSPFYDGSQADDAGVLRPRDDSDAAKAEAAAALAASEAGILEGPVRLGRFTSYYRLGDRITQVAGRGLPLRTDGGTGSTGAVYPVVVAIEHLLDDRQETVIHLSDQDGHRHKIEGKIKRGR